MEQNRVSIDVPADVYRGIKAFVALNGITVRELVNDFFIETLQKPKPKKLKAATAKAIKDARQGKNIKRFNSVSDLLAELKS